MPPSRRRLPVRSGRSAVGVPVAAAWPWRIGSLMLLAGAALWLGIARPAGAQPGGDRPPPPFAPPAMGHGPQPAAGLPMPMPMPMPMGPLPGLQLLHPRALAAVGANEDQQRRIGEILRAAQAQGLAQADARRGLQQQLAAALLAPQPDAAAAEALRQQLSTRHEADSQRQLQALLAATAVLSPEQRQQLQQRLSRREALMERHRRERDALDGPRS